MVLNEEGDCVCLALSWSVKFERRVRWYKNVAILIKYRKFKQNIPDMMQEV